MARTRSSVLIDALSKKHNVPNLYEKYQEVSPENISKLLFFKKPDLMWEKLKVETKKKTKEIIDNNQSYAIKLFPANILNDYQYNPQYTKHSNWNITSNSILDLEEYFQISKYDKIYLLGRPNLCDTICSYMYAHTTKFFLTNSVQQAKTMSPKGKLYLPKNKYYTVKTFILFQKYLENVKIYLDKRNIKYTNILYDDVPNYIQTNMPNILLDTIDTNYDYKKLFANYDEICQMINDIEKEVELEFSKTIF